MVASAINPAERTDTELSESGRCEQAVVGILWLTPRERFWELSEGGTLGRGEDCSECLPSGSVSRRHARIERCEQIWMIRDLGSKNGTFVNAARIASAPLALQDIVRIGDWVGVLCKLSRATVEADAYFSELVPGLVLSAPTAAALEPLRTLSRGNVPILLEGETGTGKELLVGAIHCLSQRSGPLVAVNCAAIPETVAESELFGYRKGAFTGAQADSSGYIADADKGTLFLDEIMELPPRIQSKLLRALAERAVIPLGKTRPQPVDFRLVAAAQGRLETLVNNGSFRADLFGRLRGAEIMIPPLRHRRQEVLRLLRLALARAGAASVELDAKAVERLCVYDWPFNVRELFQCAGLLAAQGRPRCALEDLPAHLHESAARQNVAVDGGASGATGSAVEPGAPEPAVGVSKRRSAWLGRRADELERLERALGACDGNVSEAARQAGISRHRARRLLATAVHLRR
jgi:transcriptional regulator with PAS, ATPase and Fis domain